MVEKLENPPPCFEEDDEHEWKVKEQTPCSITRWCWKCGAYWHMGGSQCGTDIESFYTRNPAEDKC